MHSEDARKVSGDSAVATTVQQQIFSPISTPSLQICGANRFARGMFDLTLRHG